MDEDKATCYAIFDRAVKRYSPPFVADNDASAIRMFKAAAVPDSMLARFPEDYVLMKIGHWNDAKGEICGFMPEVVEFGNSEVKS